MRFAILFLMVLVKTMSHAQFAPRTLTPLPVFYVAGQSNGENYWNANLYSSSVVRCSDRTEDSLELYWGVPQVHSILTAVAGKALAVVPTDVDWNVKSDGELFDGMAKNVFSDPAPSSLNKHFDALIQEGYAPNLKFILWIQGETDASDAAYANAYEQNLRDLLRMWRQDFKNPNLPVIIVKVNNTIPRGQLGPVRAAQQKIADEQPHTYIVNIDDFTQTGPEYNGPTNVHYSENGLLKILQRVVNITKSL